MYQEPYVNPTAPFTGSIADLIQRPAEARAAALRANGAVQAQGVQQVGQTIAAIPEQIAQQKEQAQKQQIQQSTIDALNQQKAGRLALAQAIKAHTDPKTGDIDHEAVANDVSGAFPDQANAWLKAASENSENIAKLRDLNEKLPQHYRETVGDIAYLSKTPEEFSAGLLLLASTPGGGLIEKQAHDLSDQLTADPSKAAQLRAQFLPFSPKYADEQKRKQQVINTPEGGTTTTVGAAEAGQPPLVTGAPKPMTTDQIAMDAATVGTPQETPTAKQSAAALERLKPPKTGADTEAELDAKAQVLFAKQRSGTPLTKAEQDELGAYEDRKRVVSDPAASAAAERQAKAIENQNVIQGKAQAFNVASKAREELLKNEGAYNQSQSAATLLLNTVDAAKNGNKIAGSLQSLQTMMDTLKAEGFNRINTAEIGVTADAGSLYDRIAGWVGKATEGQPVPADVQKDMQEYAGLLQKAAYKKYADQFDSVAKYYDLNDQQKSLKIPAPKGNLIATAGPKVGDIVTVKGQRVRVTSIGKDGTYQGIPVP